MKKLTRREMLKLVGYGAAGVALSSCCPPTPEPTDEVEPTEEEMAEPTEEMTEATEVPEPTEAVEDMGEAVVVTFVESWFGVPQFDDSIAPVTEAISAQLQSEGINVELRSMILDNHEEKYPVLYASGADFTCAFDAPWYKMPSLIDQGALLPMEEKLAEHGPNVVESTGEEIVNFNFQAGPEGEEHLYGIPARFYYSGTSGVLIREDLREKYGAPAPTSMGGYPSLEPYLQAIAENEPGMIPYANRPSYPMTDANAWASISKWLYNRSLMIENPYESLEVIETEKTAWFQFAAELCRDWYEKGYLPQEAIASDYDTLNDFLATGKAAAMIDNEPDYKYVEKGKVVSEAIEGATLMGYDLSGKRAGLKAKGNLKQWNFVVFNAQAPAEQQEAGVQVWNWFTAKQENADMWLMGIEGENYVAEADKRFSEVEGVDSARNYRRQWYVSGITGDFQRQPADLPAEAEEALNYFTNKENFIFSPYAKFDPSTKEIETELNAISAAIEEAYFGIATGSVPTEQAMATYTQMLDDAGRQTVKEWHQEKLEAWVEENQDYIDSFETGYPGRDEVTLWPWG